MAQPSNAARRQGHHQGHGGAIEHRPRPGATPLLRAAGRGIPTTVAARLIAGASAAALCLLPALATPAGATPHHKHHGSKHKKHGKPVKLSLATARSVALKSATPLILDPADKVRVTGCTKVAGPGYTCGLELHAANSASVCRWTVVVKVAGRAPDVVSYSHIDCAG